MYLTYGTVFKFYLINKRFNCIFGPQPFTFVSKSSLYFKMFQKVLYNHIIDGKC
jgi:hypothetical protein